MDKEIRLMAKLTWNLMLCLCIRPMLNHAPMGEREVSLCMG